MSKVKTALLWLMGVAYLFAGANHFLKPEFYLQMMPAYLPWHALLVQVSGVLGARGPSPDGRGPRVYVVNEAELRGLDFP